MKHKFGIYKVMYGVMSPLEYTDYVLRNIIYKRSNWGNGDVYWYSDYGSMIQKDELDRLYSIMVRKNKLQRILIGNE